MTEMTVDRRLSPAIAFLGTLGTGLVLAGLSFAGLASSSSDSLQDHFVQVWVMALIVALVAELGVAVAVSRSQRGAAIAIGVAAVLAPLAAVVAFFGFLLFQD